MTMNQSYCCCYIELLIPRIVAVILYPKIQYNEYKPFYQLNRSSQLHCLHPLITSLSSPLKPHRPVTARSPFSFLRCSTLISLAPSALLPCLPLPHATSHLRSLPPADQLASRAGDGDDGGARAYHACLPRALLRQVPAGPAARCRH